MAVTKKSKSASQSPARKKGSIIQQGRGLSALLALQNVTREPQDSLTLSLDCITPDPDQPRKLFDEEALQELADSIRTHGLLQPLLVTPEDGKKDAYRIVAGERRFHACKKAGLTEAPVRVVRGDARTLREIALIENLQRRDLTPLETARGLKALMEDCSLTQEEAASCIGWSRSAVANKVRLLALPDFVLDLLDQGSLAEGHAKALLSLKKPEKMRALAEDCAKNRWSVQLLSQKIEYENTHTVLFVNPQPKRKPWRPAKAAKVRQQLGIGMAISSAGESNRVVLNGLTREQVTRLLTLLDRETPYLKEGALPRENPPS